jgi:TP901 family phage tail tape measure protein
MAAFNLTAELNLRGPSNLNQVVSNIRRQLYTVSLNLNINPNTSRGIQTVTNNVRTLNTVLRDAQTNATALSNTLANLAASINNVGNATNNINNGLNNLRNQTRNAANGTREAASEMEEFGRQSALAVRRFAAFSVATGAIYGLVRALSSAYSEFVNFNREFVRLQQVTNSTAAGLSGLSQEITRLSTGLGVSSSELLTVSTTLAQAGLSANQTKTALEALAKSALAPSFDNLNDTVEGSIALMRQFGLSAGDLEGALGSINAVAAKFAVEAGDIITAIQRTGGVFAAASKGVSQGKDALNEFIAVFTSVRATTRESAETIATGLRTIFTRIQRGGTIQALKEFGIVLTDLQGKFVGPYEAVRRLSQGLQSLDPRDLRFSQIVEELGGFRQIGKVIPLIQQFATAQQALSVAQRGAGSLAADQAKAQEALAVRITKVREEFIALIRDIGQTQSFQKLIYHSNLLAL